MTPESLLAFVIKEADTRISQVNRNGMSSRPLQEFREFLGNVESLIGQAEPAFDSVTIGGPDVRYDLHPVLARLQNILGTDAYAAFLSTSPVFEYERTPKEPYDLSADFWDFVKREQKIRAIKELRRLTGMSLKSAKDIVDKLTEPKLPEAS